MIFSFTTCRKWKNNRQAQVFSRILAAAAARSAAWLFFVKIWKSKKNALNLEGVLSFRGWELKPSAGFQWQNAEKFGDTAQFNLEGAFNYNRWELKPSASFQVKTDNKTNNNAKFNLSVIRRF